ncbi:hypothetical protein [Marivita hallyeonensis]|uniref:Uncharacterized protein n=1 Tax=Marivita hallyeonensis TaxID=996342 RepID=A0A1M5WV83_9RHOB|nr:hypothetical protein [Marivita hallyeonensis]SHH90913.1 hypothetical protein SAMN05443551_3512 [Marivita hallyeonensis]
MEITIIDGKIHYGANLQNLHGRLQNYNIPQNAIQKTVTLNHTQFIRFKCAGRQTEMAAAKQVVDPLTGNVLSYQREDRTSGELARWDVEEYGKLTSRTAPWGKGHKTNRDHLLADSINQVMYSAGVNPYGAANANELKRRGLAVVVSGHHHRKGSETYGGRVQAIKQQHANNPTVGADSEMGAMMEYKNDPANRKSNTNKSTLRIEMVGAYCFLYKRLCKQQVMQPNAQTDFMLLSYLEAAAQTDDGFWRINPQDVGINATSATATASGTKWTI